jgi:hypothetical protein
LLSVAALRGIFFAIAARDYGACWMRARSRHTNLLPREVTEHPDEPSF